MSEEIIVPRLSWSMEEGTFGEWLKRPGDFVEPGDILYVLEGDKAAQEIEAVHGGFLYLCEAAPKPGDHVCVGQTIGYLLAKGETERDIEVASANRRMHGSPQKNATCIPATSVANSSRVAGPAARRLARELGIDINTIHTPDPTGRVLSEDIRHALQRDSRTQKARRKAIASPRAKKRAHALGVDWTQLIGSGRNGRIRERDVVLFSQTHDSGQTNSSILPPIIPGRFERASKLRLSFANRMHLATTQAAPVTLNTKVQADSLVAFREILKSQHVHDRLPTFNDILMWLLANSLTLQPSLNACWYRDGIHYYDKVHLSMGIDTSHGLVAPVIRDANQLSLLELAERTRQIVAMARSGQLTQTMLEGGTFTVTNLGMFGIDCFTPILNLPQSGILGIGRIVREPVLRDGAVAIGHTLSLSLTFDHRVIDGAPAAQWLQNFANSIAILKHN